MWASRFDAVGPVLAWATMRQTFDIGLGANGSTPSRFFGHGAVNATSFMLDGSSHCTRRAMPKGVVR
jgi:hypothetical protein